MGCPNMLRLAHELGHSFLTICLQRRPTMDAKSFQTRFASPDAHPSGPLPHVLVAAALAAGSRFTDSPVVMRDREELAERGQSSGSRADRSRISELLVIRARDIMERSAIMRVPSQDSVNALIHLDYALAGTSLLWQWNRRLTCGRSTHAAKTSVYLCLCQDPQVTDLDRVQWPPNAPSRAGGVSSTTIGVDRSRRSRRRDGEPVLLRQDGGALVYCHPVRVLRVRETCSAPIVRPAC